MKSNSRIGADAITLAIMMTEMTLLLWALSSLRCVRCCFIRLAIFTLFMQYSSHYRLVSLITWLAHWVFCSCLCDSGYVADRWIMKHEMNCSTWHSYYVGQVVDVFPHLPYWLYINLLGPEVLQKPLLSYPAFKRIPLFIAYHIQDNIMSLFIHTSSPMNSWSFCIPLNSFYILIRNYCHYRNSCLSHIRWPDGPASRDRVANCLQKT